MKLVLLNPNDPDKITIGMVGCLEGEPGIGAPVAIIGKSVSLDDELMVLKIFQQCVDNVSILASHGGQSLKIGLIDQIAEFFYYDNMMQENNIIKPREMATKIRGYLMSQRFCNLRYEHPLLNKALKGALPVNRILRILLETLETPQKYNQCKGCYENRLTEPKEGCLDLHNCQYEHGNPQFVIEHWLERQALAYPNSLYLTENGDICRK